MAKNRLHGQRRINDLRAEKVALCLIRTSMLTRKAVSRQLSAVSKPGLLKAESYL
jgi:hypothetical protein